MSDRDLESSEVAVLESPTEGHSAVSPISAPGKVIGLVGYELGNSADADSWRLYLTETLNRYQEFRKSDTVDAQRLENGQIAVSLKPDAKLSEPTEAPRADDFLVGDLQSRIDPSSWRWLDMRPRQPVACIGPETPKSNDPTCTGNSMCVKKTRNPDEVDCSGR